MSYFAIGNTTSIVVVCTRGDTYADAATFSIDPGATVKAILVGIDRTIKLSPQVTCVSNHVEADWANSRVAIEFSKEESDAVKGYGVTDQADLGAEVEIEIDGESYFADIEITASNIS